MAEQGALGMMRINTAVATTINSVPTTRADMAEDMEGREEVLGEVLEVVDILMELDLILAKLNKESNTELDSVLSQTFRIIQKYGARTK